MPEVYRGDSDDEIEPVSPPRGGSGRLSGSSSLMHPSAAERLAVLTTVVSLAERYFDRFDSASFLAMLPTKTPLALLAKYLNIIVEFNNTKKRNLQVIFVPTFSLCVPIYVCVCVCQLLCFVCWFQ